MGHRSVEREARRGEVRVADEGEGVLGAVLAIHARVLPLDRKRPVVADAVERPEECLEVDVAVAGRDEVPAAGLLTEVQVRPEDRAAPVESLLRVLHVHVVDAVGELAGELRGVEVLVARSATGRG